MKPDKVKAEVDRIMKSASDGSPYEVNVMVGHSNTWILIKREDDSLPAASVFQLLAGLPIDFIKASKKGHVMLRISDKND